MFGKRGMKIAIVTVVFLGVLSSCDKLKKEVNTVGRLDLETTNVKDKPNDKKGLKLIADLPIKIDSSSNFIVFHINTLGESDSSDKMSYTSRKEYHHSYLKNLIFQNIQTDMRNVLTTDKIEIVSYEQLYVEKNKPENVILYQVIDNFSEDKDALTLTGLYLSTEGGENFTKISEKGHHLTNWEYYPELKKVFFKTIEDSDRNNALDNLDTHHIYSVSIQDFKAKELLKEEFKMLSD